MNSFLPFRVLDKSARDNYLLGLGPLTLANETVLILCALGIRDAKFPHQNYAATRVASGGAAFAPRAAASWEENRYAVSTTRTCL